MIDASLPISGLVAVSATLAAAAAQAQSTQTCLVLGSSAVIDIQSRMREYTSSAAVLTDFGSNAPESNYAVEWFGQSPQPTSLFIGRWAQTATSGQLIGAPLSAAQQAIATWQAITDGGLTIQIDAEAAEQVSPLTFAGAANMNGVAAVIQAKLTGATIVWNSVYSQFIVTSDTTGATSSVSFASAPTGEGITDISSMLGLNVASSGAYQAAGIAAESALAAATLFDENFGQQWYALSILGAADTDHTAVAVFLNSSSNKHFYGASTQEAGVIVAATTTDLASLMKTSSASNAAVQYNGSSPYAVASLLARILTTDWTGNNTAINLMWKQEPGITADNLTSTQLAALLSKNCNAFLNYNNGTAIIQPGICSDGTYIDTAIGKDALVLAIQTAVYNLLYTNTTKIPQTDAGMHQVKTAIESVCAQFVANGYGATGLQWNGPLFGALQNSSDGTPPTLTKGYYVYQPLVASQSASQRAQRLSVPFQIAFNLAGAVNTVSVAITLNN